MKTACIIHKLAGRMAGEQELKAIWFDAEKKQVSVACAPGADAEAARKRCAELLDGVTPDDMPDCRRDGDEILCRECKLKGDEPLPAGIKLVPLPGAGLLLEKQACDTARKVWRWHVLPSVHLETKHLPKPSEDGHAEHWKHDLAFALVCAAATAAGFAIEKLAPASARPIAIAAYVVAYVSGAWHPAEEVWELLKKRILDVHFLMLCVAVGAAIIGHWWEGALLLFLFSFSGALEELAMARTEREISSLFKAAPKEATVVEASGERRLAVESVQAGMVLRVRPGEQFPVDAEVVTGASAANESNLTGESVPVDKVVGNTVFSGTLNLWGSVDCRALRPATESALAKIVKLIKDAQDSKAPSQRFTDKFGTGYTYLILGLSTAMFLFWWLVKGLPAFHYEAGGQASAFYRAMTLLVVASPCALVLSIPSAILAGIAAGARQGVLFRGGSAIEKLAGITRVAMDKTGTLTTGELDVLRVESTPSGSEAEIARIAAALGHHSTHPVSRALAAHGRSHAETTPDTVKNFRSLTGLGVEGEFSSYGTARMGRRALFGDAAWVRAFPEPEIGVTETLVEAGALRGRVLLRDSVRAASAPLLRQLEASGIHATMLTGDRPEAAQQVAGQLGLREVRAGLKPEQKVAAIQDWVKAGERVAMIGDGVNDAPSLAAADVAVGMGLRGSDAVLEQADVVLMRDKLENFNFALELSRRARTIIRQNLAISLGTVAVLVLSAIGSAIPLPIGVVGHEGSTVIVVMNSLRLLFFRPRPLA